MSAAMGEHSKVYDVKIDSEVDEEIADHAYFLGCVSVGAAERLITALYDDMDSLKKMPSRNPPYMNELYPEGDYRFMLSEKRYKIVCEIYEELGIVHVVQALDARRRNSPLERDSR